MWKLFATAYPDAFARVAQYRLMKIGSLKLSLRDYLGMVRSDSLNWRVVLTLATSFAKVPELVEISRVRNLVALEISTPREVQSVVDGDSGDLEMSVTALSDRIFRTWSELAQGAGAFAHLRVLKLYYQEDLSKGVLQYLMEFPSLRFLIVYECPGLSSIGMDEDLDGWEVTAEPVVSKEWPVMSLYSSYQASLVADIDGEPSTINLICPILDFQIGPRTGPLPSREHDRAKTLCLRRRTEPRPASKKLKTIQKPSGPRKRMMKDRRGKDIGESLREFL
ncbi:uncharacterized protein ATNIH1004_008950 [Aspergillus tanneri]|nr:uncharacterized protein ATNIH1004_008950 [Aspergillus tanneri]KAA8644743.1 hypothetical protein ATNIH1004_008950 [Aspergillus tanneri]